MWHSRHSQRWRHPHPRAESWDQVPHLLPIQRPADAQGTADDAAVWRPRCSCWPLTSAWPSPSQCRIRGVHQQPRDPSQRLGRRIISQNKITRGPSNLTLAKPKDTVSRVSGRNLSTAVHGCPQLSTAAGRAANTPRPLPAVAALCVHSAGRRETPTLATAWAGPGH